MDSLSRVDDSDGLGAVLKLSGVPEPLSLLLSPVSLSSLVGIVLVELVLGEELADDASCDDLGC